MKQILLWVALSATILQGCTPKQTAPVRPMPKAAFTWTNTGGGAVQLTNQSTEADTYSWSFGDGSAVSTETSPTYTYVKNARYTVSFTATNPTGNHKVTGDVEVTSVPAPAPVASFSVLDRGEGRVSFNNNSMNARLYAWDFGNGTTSAAQDPGIIQYLENKTYTIVLAVSGDGGLSSSSKTITITSIKVPTPPVTTPPATSPPTTVPPTTTPPATSPPVTTPPASGTTTTPPATTPPVTSPPVTTPPTSTPPTSGTTTPPPVTTPPTTTPPATTPPTSGTTPPVTTPPATTPPKTSPPATTPPATTPPTTTPPSTTPPASSGCGTHNGKTLIKGPEGGCYYINSNGNKTYVDRSECKC